MAPLTKRSLLVLTLALLVSLVAVTAVVLDSGTDGTVPGTEADGVQPDDGTDGVEPDNETDSVEPDAETGRNTYDVGRNPEITTVEPLPEGGYLVGGHVWMNDSRDAVVLRIGANHSLESVHRFGEEKDAQLADLVRTDDGGVAFVGRYGEFETSVGWIVSADADGEVVYEKQFGPSTRDADRVNALVATDNDTIAAVGRTSRGVSNGTAAVLYELNADGDVLLEHVYREGSNRSARDIVQAGSEGYLIAGADAHQPIPQQTNETATAWFAQVASTGEPMWTTETRRGERRGAVAEEIVHAYDGGYVAAIVTARRGIGGGRGMVLQRLNPQGEVVWTQDAEHTCSSGGSPLARGANGYALVRWTCTDDSPNSDATVERWTMQGHFAWGRTFSDADEHELDAVTVRENGTVVAAGTVDEDIWLQTVTAADRSTENSVPTSRED